MSKIFFQSSLPRAGSTLLQNILAQNPDVYSTPTSGVSDFLLTTKQMRTNNPAFMAQDDGTMKEAFRGFCRGGIEGYFSRITDKPYIIDKSRSWMSNWDFVHFFYPNPKIICMVRDPRAIFASAEKAIRKNPDKSPNLPNENLRNITMEQRIDWYAQESFIGHALLSLKEMIYQKNDSKVLFVKYENLTQNPQLEIGRIYQYLDIPLYPHDFDNVEQKTHENDVIHGIFGDHKIHPQIKYQQPDFEDVLTPNISNAIKNHYQWFYDYFYYN